MLETFHRISRLAALLFVATLSVSRAATQNSLKERYFPPSEFGDLEQSRATEPHAWAEYLAALKEPPLVGNKKLHFAIRLAIAPAFPTGKVVRVLEDTSGTTVGTSRHFYYGTFNLISTDLSVRKQDISSIRKALSDDGFWTLNNHQSVIVTDGPSVLLEVWDNGKYHAVTYNADDASRISSTQKLLLRIDSMSRQ